jgi:endonuclease/exonuclease/phosphatase family metal-dependent hydrolase
MTLRVLTLNLWHDQGPWPARAARIREWLDRLDPDVVGFQEALRAPDLDQVAALLGDRLQHRDYVCAGRFRRGDRELEFGNAIASRWPILDRDASPLPDRGDAETRAALHTTIDAPFGALAFSCTHLHWKFHHGEVRCRQVAEIAKQVVARRPRGGFPPLLVGDFNAEPDSDEIRFLTGGHVLDGRSVYFHDAWRVAGEGGVPVPREPDGTTWSNRNPYACSALEPARRIDYVFAGYPTSRGLGLIESCRVVCDEAKDGVWPSDHFGVYAELRTEPLAQDARAPVFGHAGGG